MIRKLLEHKILHYWFVSEPVAGIPNSKLEEIFQTAVDKHLDAEVDDSGTNAAKNAISNLVKVIAEFSHIVDKTDFDLLSPSNEKPPDRPIVLRAIAVKKELDETKVSQTQDAAWTKKCALLSNYNLD